MQHPEKKALSDARFERAKESLAAAQHLIDMEQYMSAANRLYYAVFHAMRSVLAFDGIDMKHHSGIISEFRRLYIKTGVFDKSLSNTITLAYDMRTGSDYDDFYVISKADVSDLYADVNIFLNAIRQHISTR